MFCVTERLTKFSKDVDRIFKRCSHLGLLLPYASRHRAQESACLENGDPRARQIALLNMIEERQVLRSKSHKDRSKIRKGELREERSHIWGNHHRLLTAC